MEKKQQDILHFQPHIQAKLLYDLFEDKILDKFVSYCQILLEAKIDLSKLSIQNKLSCDLQQKYKQMKRILDNTNRILEIAKGEDEKDWYFTKIDEECGLWVKTYGTMIQIKSRGTLKVNLKNLLCVAYLIKLYDQCLPFCKESFDIKEISRIQKVGFIRLSIPVPFIKDRSTLLMGLGIDRAQKNNTACIYAESINSNQQILKRENINSKDLMKGRQLLDLKYFAVETKYLGKDKMSYAGCAVIDHHIPILPQKVIQFVIKEVAKYLFNHLMKQLFDFKNSIWAKEMEVNYQLNRQFYDWIENRMNNWQKKFYQKQKTEEKEKEKEQEKKTQNNSKI